MKLDEATYEHEVLILERFLFLKLETIPPYDTCRL